MNPRSEWVDAEEATQLLGVRLETLYSYVSRRLVRAMPAPGAPRRSLYHRDDLERLRARSLARSGHGPVAAAALLWGEPVLETKVGSIDARGPVYRGRAAIDLVRDGVPFEEVCAILWDAPFGASTQVSLGVPVAALRVAAGEGGGPFEFMCVAAAAIAAREPRGETREAARAGAGILVRRLVASCAIAQGRPWVAAALEARGVARSLLVALGAKPTSAAVSAVDAALVLAADHELNPSTFAARVAASAGASVASSVVAALATLSGPLHGGATARVEAFVAEVREPERAASAVAARLDRGESVPGFGHPLYPDGDPRGRHLLDLAAHLAPKRRDVRVLLATSRAMERIARERPTLDVGLVALASSLGLPPASALAIFACGRLAGWIGHVLEQREAGVLLRPRARYVGV